MKILLLIPMSIVELFTLAICWVVAFVHKPTGGHLLNWVIKKLPDINWYLK